MKQAIVTICSDNYVKYTLVLIYSFFKNNEWFDGDFLILYDNVYTSLNDKNIQYLESLNNKIKCIKVDISLYHQTCNKFISHIAKKYWISCCLKFYIFELYNKYDKVLYLDGDMLVTNSIKNIFDLNVSFAAVSEGIYHNNIIKTKNEYFNAGFMYFGNKTYLNLLSKILEFANDIDFVKSYKFNNREVKTFWAWELDIINVYLMNEETYRLPNIYNEPFTVENNHLTNSDWKLNESIIHYWTKPDKALNYKPAQLWNDYKNEMKTNYENLGIHILL